MAQNRSIPYGYKIANGALMENAQEVEVIVQIYKEYINGASYLGIAKSLTRQGVRYTQEKPTWNKNMVARILQNEKYCGDGKYPPIIERRLFSMAHAAKKKYEHTQADGIQPLKQKLVCNLCGSPLKRRIKPSGQERWFCPLDTHHISLSVTDESILQDVVALQKIMTSTTMQKEKLKQTTVSLETIRLSNEIEQLLAQTEVERQAIKQCVMQLAAMQYRLIEDVSYNERAKLQALKRSEKEIDVKLLQELAQEIRMRCNHITEIKLKSGRVIAMKGAIYESGNP